MGGYGSTYEEASQEQSVVKKLVDEFGYSREHLEGIEIETKIDIYNRFNKSSRHDFLKTGEKIKVPVPYMKDKILKESYHPHHFYARIDQTHKTLESAFVEIMTGGSIKKLKLKGETKITKKNGIYLTKRDEEHISMSQTELIPTVAKIVRGSPFPIAYVGAIHKYSKECFMFNHLSGRIFVLSSGFCEEENTRNSLRQLEVEYYGQINGYQGEKSAEDELIWLTHKVLKKIPKTLCPRPSKLTKLEWLVNQNKQFKQFRVL